MADSRLFFPATARNRGPILDVLSTRVAPQTSFLEIASGSGEHGAHFCAERPGWEWQPSDMEAAHLASIEAWRRHASLPNLLPPIRIDVTQTWPAVRADAVFCANMVHIAPWEATEALFAGAGMVLAAGAPLFLYGPFMRERRHTAESNASFHMSLQERDARWGVRDLADVQRAAVGFTLEEIVEMPANNLVLCLRRDAR